MDLDATVGSPTMNSYLTVDEANDYFSMRLTVEEWENAESQDALLQMATRVMDSVISPHRIIVRPSDGSPPYYRELRTWTGAIATTTQTLMWPRTGMYTRTGAEILSTEIPRDLKYATAELAAQLARGDRTADNKIAVQGITSVRAGSVAITFKDMIESNVIPEAVWALLVPSWLTDEIVTQVYAADFMVVS
jgi:hypothetical protein